MAKTTAVATREQLAASLRGDLTEKQFETLVSNQQKRFERIRQVQLDSNKKSIPLYWESGDELKRLLFKSAEPKPAVIKNFAELAGISEASMRRAYSLAATYDKERMLWLVEHGMHMGHLEHLLKIADDGVRRKLEERVADSEMTTKDVKQLVHDATNKDAGAMKPSASKRQAERNSQKQKDSTNPVKALPFMTSKVRDVVEASSDLALAFDNIRGMAVEDQVQLLPAIAELVELVEPNISLLSTLRTMCAEHQGAIQLAKSSATAATPPAPQKEAKAKGKGKDK